MVRLGLLLAICLFLCLVASSTASLSQQIPSHLTFNKESGMLVESSDSGSWNPSHTKLAPKSDASSSFSTTPSTGHSNTFTSPTLRRLQDQVAQLRRSSSLLRSQNGHQELDSNRSESIAAPASHSSSASSSDTEKPLNVAFESKSIQNSASSVASSAQLDIENGGGWTPSNTLPPWVHYDACYDFAPGPMFRCRGGVWSTNETLTIGPGGDMEVLNITTVTYIAGDLVILPGGVWNVLPAFNAPYESRGQPMLMLDGCLVSHIPDSTAPPYNILGRYSASYVKYRGKKGKAHFVILDMACESSALVSGWNNKFGYAASVSLKDLSKADKEDAYWQYMNMSASWSSIVSKKAANRTAINETITWISDPPTLYPAAPYFGDFDHSCDYMDKYRPGPMFTCENGIWATNQSLVIGPGGILETIRFSSVTYIGGNLTILDGATTWIFEPGLDDWYEAANISLLTIDGCLNFQPGSRSTKTTGVRPPLVFLGSQSYDSLIYGKSPKTNYAIDSRCDTTAYAARWNILYNDAQPVNITATRRAFYSIAQYRTFPSVYSPEFSTMRLRFQWREGLSYMPYPVSPNRMSTGGIVAFSIMGSVFFIVGCYLIFLLVIVPRYKIDPCCGCQCGDGSGGGDGGYSYGATDWGNSGGGGGGGGSDFGGGGGGGGGGWTASSAGSWD